MNAFVHIFSAWTWKMAWRDSRKDRDILTAAAALSIGLGNHLTIATVAPAFIVFVLWTDRARSLRARVVLGVAMAIVIGVSQYLYILIRTRQHAAMTERARAVFHPSLEPQDDLVCGQQACGRIGEIGRLADAQPGAVDRVAHLAVVERRAQPEIVRHQIGPPS